MKEEGSDKTEKGNKTLSMRPIRGKIIKATSVRQMEEDEEIRVILFPCPGVTLTIALVAWIRKRGRKRSNITREVGEKREWEGKKPHLGNGDGKEIPVGRF